MQGFARNLDFVLSRLRDNWIELKKKSDTNQFTFSKDPGSRHVENESKVGGETS